MPPIRGDVLPAYTFGMNTTALIAVLASMLVGGPRHEPQTESYEWVAGDVKPWELGYSNCNERLERPRK